MRQFNENFYEFVDMQKPRHSPTCETCDFMEISNNTRCVINIKFRVIHFTNTSLIDINDTI